MSEQRTYWRHGMQMLDSDTCPLPYCIIPFERVHVLTDADLAARDAEVAERIAQAIEVWAGGLHVIEDQDRARISGMRQAATIAREEGSR